MPPELAAVGVSNYGVTSPLYLLHSLVVCLCHPTVLNVAKHLLREISASFGL